MKLQNCYANVSLNISVKKASIKDVMSGNENTTYKTYSVYIYQSWLKINLLAERIPLLIRIFQPDQKSITNECVRQRKVSRRKSQKISIHFQKALVQPASSDLW